MPSNIPFIPMTDPANFPSWSSTAGPGESGAEFPKCLNRIFTKADVAPWLEANKRIDTGTKEIHWLERCPRPGDVVPLLATEDVVEAGLAQNIGDQLVVNSPAEERAVMLLLQQAEPEPELTEPKPGSFAVDINADVEHRISEVEAENARLRAALKAKPKRRSRAKPKKRAKPAAAPVTVEPELSDDQAEV